MRAYSLVGTERTGDCAERTDRIDAPLASDRASESGALRACAKSGGNMNLIDVKDWRTRASRRCSRRRRRRRRGCRHRTAVSPKIKLQTQNKHQKTASSENEILFVFVLTLRRSDRSVAPVTLLAPWARLSTTRVVGRSSRGENRGTHQRRTSQKQSNAPPPSKISPPAMPPMTSPNSVGFLVKIQSKQTSHARKQQTTQKKSKLVNRH